MGGGWVSRRAVVAAKPGTRCSGMVERVAGENSHFLDKDLRAEVNIHIETFPEDQLGDCLE